VRTIKESWESYEDLVIPKTAGPVQRHETKQAFYAGAFVVFGITEMVAEPYVPEDMGIAQLEALKAELEAYRAEIKGL
jgi:hypothetical protein